MTRIKKPGHRLPTIQIGVTAALAGIYYAFGTMHQAASAFSGGMIVWLNWLLLSWSWWQILGKKSFALAVSVIVLKYLILGTAIIVLVRQPWLQPVPLVLGIGSLVPTVLICAILNRMED